MFAGKVCHTVDHIYLTSCIDPVCPAFRICLVDQSAVGFDDDNGLDLEKKFEIQNDKILQKFCTHTWTRRKSEIKFNLLAHEPYFVIL